MNKHLLFGTAVLLSMTAFPQAGKQVKPTGIVNQAAKNVELNENLISNSVVKNTSVNSITKPLAAAKTSSTPASSCKKFSSSYNALGVYINGQECLQYNPQVPAVTFVQRASPNYSTVASGNSGTIVMKWTMNTGTSWDSTVIWANTTNFARYPQGGLYNPLGNTNINNAYAIAMGPTNQGAAWLGSYFASKKITTPGTNVGGADQQYFPDTSPFGTLGKKVDFPRYGFAYTYDGLVRGIGEICNNTNATTASDAPAYQSPRGEAVLKGTFNAGAFVWSYDSLVPPTILRSGGSKQMTNRMADMAWNDAGTVGYVMMIGARAGTSGTTKGYQPMVYKTTNSGASWALLPVQDFMTPQFKGLVDRMWATASNTNLAVPFFSSDEGLDMAVDVNNNLHIVTTVVGSYSNHSDSLEYTSSWGTEKYSFPYGSFGYPTIYDFYTTSSGGWNYHIVDSMATEGPSGVSTGGGFANNPWGASGAYIDARIQISHSPDRKKMFYSWTETDTSTVSNLHWNAFPDIYMRGFDVTIDKVTKRQNVTGGVTLPNNADQSAYWHLMANRAITTNSVLNTNEIPFTISYNGSNDITVETSHYYLKGASFTQTDFTINPLRPVGVQSLANNTPNYEVVAYPNPASGSTTISVKLKEVKNFEINIYNTVGALIQTMNVNGQIGNNDVTLDISKLSAGVYFYNVKADNSVITNKLIVE